MKNKEVLALKAKKFYSSISIGGMIVSFILLFTLIGLNGTMIKGDITFGIMLCSIIFFALLLLYMFVNNHRLVVYPDRFEKYNLLTKKESIIEIHNPTDVIQLKKARQRLKYEELFMYLLKINYLKSKTEKDEKALSREIDIDKIN